MDRRQWVLGGLAALMLAAAPGSFDAGGLKLEGTAYAQRNNQPPCPPGQDRCDAGNGSQGQNGSSQGSQGQNQGQQQPWQQLLDPNRPALTPEQERALIENGWNPNRN